MAWSTTMNRSIGDQVGHPDEATIITIWALPHLIPPDRVAGTDGHCKARVG